MEQLPMESELRPRPYQVILYEKAIKENSIIYLPTGSGKTYICVLLIRKLSNAVQRPYSDGGKRTVFIVNTVSLVIQQSAFLNRHTGLLCKGYSGDMQVDYWSEQQWRNEIDSNQVLIMTAQIFLDLLLHGKIVLNKVNLLIFDECHRAVKDHPMRLIMQRMKNCPQNEQPRILAMSATLLNSSVKLFKIEETIKELEVTFMSKINTVDSSMVSNFSTNPKEFLVFYETPSNLSAFDDIFQIIENALKVLDHVDIPNKFENSKSSKCFMSDSKNSKLKRILNDVQIHFEEMGLYGGSRCVLLHMIQLEMIKKSADDSELIAIIDFLITQLMKIGKLSFVENVLMPDFIYKFLSPKVLQLLDTLKNFYNNILKNDEKFCCIIFVKRRFTAKVLYHILKNIIIDKDFEFLKPEFIIGYDNDPFRNARETLCLSKWNKESLANFRSGVCNCLVATDVIDEGIDIPSCTLVIRYQFPMDFRSYIQSKGRARHSSSHYVMLISKEDNFVERYHFYQKIETNLKMQLCGKTEFRQNITSEEVDTVLYNFNIEPYEVIQKDGSKCAITEHSAISLLNMYCARLMISKFFTLSPTWVKIDIPTKTSMQYQVHITLPEICPIKDTIIGDVMPSVVIAKRSAALKTCIALHKIGELDDNLLPKSVESSYEDYKYLFPYMENEEKIPNAFPGTKSKKRSHKLIYPECLYAAYPKQNLRLYLHKIQMKPNYPKPVSDNRNLVFHELLSSNFNYGILSSKPMSKIPSFPIYMNVGDLQIDIKTYNQMLSLTNTEINSLKIFHTLVFSQILKTIKEFTIFDLNNEENCYLVVPINDKEEIDWKVVHENEIIKCIPPTKPIQVKNIDYEFKLVTPNYRASSNVYIVTDVCEYLKAESNFPTQDFYSYVHYFKDRHNVEIENEAQPMLEVKPISGKINCIKPRNIKAGLSKRKRANLIEDFEEHLVPELCDRIDFPAVYWLKATTLPSILHRVSQILVAEDLRIKIESEANLCSNTLEKSVNWKPLKIEEKLNEITEFGNDSACEDSFLEDEELDVEKLPIQENEVPVDILSQEKSLYSWTKAEEPRDLDRCADKIQLIDIEYYHQFMSNVTAEDMDNLKYQYSTKKVFMPATNISVPLLKILQITDSYGPSPVDIMKSLTSKISNDAFNNEREETLGDSFLKFAISLFLYQSFPICSEGQLTFLKGKLVGNLNLFYCAKQKDIPGRMNVEDFSPISNFVTPSYITDRLLRNLLIDLEVSANLLYEWRIPKEERFCGIISNATRDIMKEKLLSWPPQPMMQTSMEHFLGMQIISDKTVSDCVEALIGTYLLHLGIPGAFKILKWFEILPKNLDIKKLLNCNVPNPRLEIIKLETEDIDKHLPCASMIEDKLGYKFHDRAFLLQALTHPSYNSNRITSSYQRLEFLGDAVLDFLITVYIYESCGNLNPGELTDLRSALVNNITFACLAVRYSLHTALLAYSPKLFDAIERFVKFQEDRNHEVNDEIMILLLEEEECNMSEYVDVPKALGDIFESVIGAIFLDSGKNLQKVWQVIYCLMKNEIDLFSKNVPKQPIRLIYETQGAMPVFSAGKIIEISQTIMVTLTIHVNGKEKYFHGFGKNKKCAKCAAAKQALKYLAHKQ